jgi:hypothetical protein
MSLHDNITQRIVDLHATLANPEATLEPWSARRSSFDELLLDSLREIAREVDALKGRVVELPEA